MALLLGIGAYLGSRVAAPEPPAVVLQETDPAVRVLIQEAYEAVHRSPRSAAAWGRLGMVLLAHDFLSEARVCLAESERLEPQEPRWPYYQGVLLSFGNPEAAIAKLARAVELCGDAPDAPRLRFAEMLLDQGRYPEAQDQFSQLLLRDPGHARAHLGLARLSYQREDLADALAQLGSCKANPFTQKAAAALLAQIQQRMGEQTTVKPGQPPAADLPEDTAWPDPFMAEVEQLKTGRQGGIAHLERLLAQKRVPQAIEFLQERLRDDPDSGWAWLWLGRLLIQEEQFVAAEEVLREAVRHARGGMDRMLSRPGSSNQATRTPMGPRAPQSAETQFYLGVALYCQGKSGEAAVFFRRAAELKPDYSLAYYNLGHCLIQQGERKAALSAFRMAVRYKANFADAQVNLGDLLIQNRQYGEGLQHLRYAAELNPGDPRTRKLMRETLAHLAGCIGP